MSVAAVLGRCQIRPVPELAEVELARRQWATQQGSLIEKVETHPKTRIFRDCPAAALQILVGQSLTGSHAHGKRMYFQFGEALSLELHLGMSGKLFLGEPDHQAHKHDHLILRTAEAALVLSDYRQFGRVVLHEDSEPWQTLPPQPHERAFSIRYLEEKITRHGRKPLKGFLLDQSICPGIGNWMADEICWKMGLHPALTTGMVDPADLRKAIRFVALGALKHVAEKNSQASAAGFAPGSYVSQVPPKSWLFQHRWKPGGHCPRCRSELDRATIATRTTAWCPACQPE